MSTGMVTGQELCERRGWTADQLSMARGLGHSDGLLSWHGGGPFDRGPRECRLFSLEHHEDWYRLFARVAASLVLTGPEPVSSQGSWIPVEALCRAFGWTVDDFDAAAGLRFPAARLRPQTDAYGNVTYVRGVNRHDVDQWLSRVRVVATSSRTDAAA